MDISKATSSLSHTMKKSLDFIVTRIQSPSYVLGKEATLFGWHV